MMKLILEDDILFQDLMTRIRKESLTTNAGIAMALHSSILETMKPEVKSKYPSLNSEDLPSDTQNNVAWPLPNPAQAFHQVAKLLPARVRTKATDTYTATCRKFSLETRNSKWKGRSDVFVNSSFHQYEAPQRLAPGNKSNATWGKARQETNYRKGRDSSFQRMNLHDIKYMTMEELRPRRTFSMDSLTSCITAYSRDRRKSVDKLKIPKTFSIETLSFSLSEFSLKRKENSSTTLTTVADNSICTEEGEEGATSRRTSLWTEDTVEELYNETVEALYRRNSSWSEVGAQELFEDTDHNTPRRNSLWTEETVQELYEETVCGKRLNNWSAETRLRQQFYDDELMEK